MCLIIPTRIVLIYICLKQCVEAVKAQNLEKTVEQIPEQPKSLLYHKRKEVVKLTRLK